MTTYLTPAAVVDNLLKTGVKISERTLREKARAIGAYRQVGRAMFFLPADVEKIMEPTCLNSSNAPARHSGSRAAPSTGSASKEALDAVKRMMREGSPTTSPLRKPAMRLVQPAR